MRQTERKHDCRRFKKFHRADYSCGVVRPADRGALRRCSVERRVNLGGTLICHQALVAGKIDLYPEYTGTALTAVLNDPLQKDPAEVFHHVQEEYRTRFNVEAMPPLGFNNTFSMVVRGDDAEKLHLRTISDVGPAYAPKWRAGFGYEFKRSGRTDIAAGSGCVAVCILPGSRGFSISDCW